jgi:hypothetical protein
MSDATGAVFLSYASQDSEAARRIAQALRAEGIEVWFDADGGLEHGDEWDAKIRKQIKECVLFIPIISAQTQARHEGYFRIEWELAAQRAMGIASGIAFILPVVIDDTREPDALVPDRFRIVQWTRLPSGVVTPEVKARYLKLWSHRTGAAKPVVPREPDSAGVGIHPADNMVSAPVAAPPIPRRAVPLVGRAAEMALLRRHLERLAAGHGGTVLLGGEPGVGKTRLAEAVLQEAFARGWLCAVGHCYEMEGTPAYTPVIEQLEQLARARSVPELRAVLGDAAPEIARFFPGLRRLLPDVGLPMELPPEQQRPYLHARFREYVERLAARGPVVVLTDDLHWADDSSLLLLEALAPHLATLPVLIVGTYRDVELEIGRPFAAVLERLTRQRHAERVAVRRLPEADVAALLAALGGSPSPATLVQAIQHETEGNPFFVEEVFAHLKEEGRLFDAAGAWRTDLSLTELEVPEGVKLVIGRRLARVAEPTRAALMIAAVIGPRFAPRLVEEVAGVSGDVVLDALDEAERAGLVRQLGGAREVRYGFAHELIRHTLLSGLSGPRRQRWHLKIADALERLYATRLDEYAADLAYHLYEAGAAAEPPRAIGALIRAAQAALDAGACQATMMHLARAESIEPADLNQRAAILRIRSGAARGLGHWNDAIRDGEAALQLCRSLDTVEHELLYAQLVEMLVYHSQLPHALALVRQRRISAEPSVTGVLLAAWSGFAEGTVGDEAVAAEAFAEAERLAKQLGDPYPAAVTRFVRSMYFGHRGRLRESVSGYKNAAAELMALREDWYAAPSLSHAMWAESMLGHGAAATELESTARAVADRVGHAGAREHVEGICRVLNWARTGDIAATMGDIVRAEPRMRAASPTLANFSEALAFLLRFYQGQWSEPLSRLATLGNEHKIETWNHLYDAYAFLLKSYRMEPDARDVLRQFQSRLPRPGGERVLGTWWVLKSVIEGLVVRGDRNEAAAFYDAACEMVELGFVLEFTGAFETSTGLAAACGGKWALAERHFENAMKSCETGPHILGQGETRRWYAWMCLERGTASDSEKALGLLDGAQRVYERIGMPKHLELVQALRARAEQRR